MEYISRCTKPLVYSPSEFFNLTRIASVTQEHCTTRQNWTSALVQLGRPNLMAAQLQRSASEQVLSIQIVHPPVQSMFIQQVRITGISHYESRPSSVLSTRLPVDYGGRPHWLRLLARPSQKPSLFPSSSLFTEYPRKLG